MFASAPSDSFTLHGEVPKGAEPLAIYLEEIYHRILAKVDKSDWDSISSENVFLEYNTCTGITKTGLNFGDFNGGKHSVFLEYVPANEFGDIAEAGNLYCEYRLQREGTSDKIRKELAFVEVVRLNLLKKGIKADLFDNSKGLKVEIKQDKALRALWTFFYGVGASIECNVKNLTESQWDIEKTYQWLKGMLPLIQEEARKDRWQDIKPQYFKLRKTPDECFIILEYKASNLYNLTFRIGRDKYFHFDEPYEVEINYIFEPTSNDNELNSFLDKENNKFLKQNFSFLSSLFSHNVYFCSWDNEFQNGVELKFALQKYCLMLDVMLPLMEFYEAPQPLLAQQYFQQNKALEHFQISIDFEVVEDSTPFYLYRAGNWI